MSNTNCGGPGMQVIHADIVYSEDREHLAELFTQCGLIRVTNSSDMSAYFPGECHDGEYALNRYVRIVNVEV